MNEQAFRRGIRSRDPAVWARVVELYDPPLRRLAQRILGRGLDADNAVGDLWVKALAQAKRYDPSLKPFPWLARLCANLCLTQRRRGLRLVQSQPERIEPGRHEEDEDARRALYDALRSLPRREREIVTLRYLFGVSVDEIALLRRRSRKTVEKTLLRALRRLRATLDETGHSALREGA